jgi:CheY-like chemotaxis protein
MLSTATRDEGDGAAVIVESLQADDQPHLRGKRILVVEDEFYIADDVYRLLKRAGAEVVGPVSSVEAAERVVDQAEFDCAVLDLNLHGQSAICIADRLEASGPPS